MTWTQNYDPFGSPVLSTLVAAFAGGVAAGLLATGGFTRRCGAIRATGCARRSHLAFTPVEAGNAASGGQGRGP